MLPQFSIRALFLAVTIIGSCLACDRAYKRWYVRKYTGHYVFSVLRDSVHDGDKPDEIALLFETATKVNASEPIIQNLWKSRSTPIVPDDEFWRFGCGDHGFFGQFRDSRLVHHRARDYANLDQVAQLNHFPVPPKLLRYGVWPFCIALLGIGGILLFAMRHKRLRRVARTEVLRRAC
jgi:hypothetical protein